jgi:CSLREA domain-containing protein
MLKRIFLFLLFSFGFLLVVTARAANFTVNNIADTSDIAAGNGVCADAVGNCTLRAAVEEANALSGDDIINCDVSLTNATITLTTGVQITVNGSGGTLQINGLGANKLTVDGGAGSNRIFFTTHAASLTMTGMTLQGGGSVGGGPDGAAINTSGGTLVLNAVYVRNNSGGAQNGGGIFFNGGTNHRILNSTISNNSSANGGGLYLAGGTLFMANSTISGNTITGQGGGALLNGGAATFRNVTITNNTANSINGGIQVGGGITFNMGNTIIAGNNAPNFPDIGNFDGTTSAGNNFIGDSPGDSTATINPIAYQPSDIQNQNPLLGILQNNGGPTPTHSLPMNSLAVNTGDNAKAVNPFDNSALTFDQRGFSLRTSGGTVDIGAFEFSAAPTSASVSIGGRVFADKESGLGKAQVFLTDSTGEIRMALTNQFGYFRFDDVEVSETYIFTVSHKRYQFAPQVIYVSEELTELTFMALSTVNQK